MKRYLPGGRGQPTVIVPAAIPLSILAALIPCRLGQPVRLRFQQVIQRFFHAPAYKFPDFPLDYFLVQCYNLPDDADLVPCFWGLFSILLFRNLRNLLYLIRFLNRLKMILYELID